MMNDDRIAESRGRIKPLERCGGQEGWLSASSVRKSSLVFSNTFCKDGSIFSLAGGIILRGFMYFPFL